MKNVNKILIVVTSHSELGHTGKKSGYYLPEVSHPADVFSRAGFVIDFASPKGGKSPMDPGYDESDLINRSFLSDQDMMKKIGNTIRADQVDAAQYQAIFFAGGHGTMWDFREERVLQELTRKIYESGKIVSAVCHGPAALIDVKLSDGTYLVKGKKVAAFTNDEEDAHETATIVPFLLETALIERGAIHSKAGLWKEHVQSDGRLVTGQNPASAGPVAERVVETLKKLPSNQSDE